MEIGNVIEAIKKPFSARSKTEKPLGKILEAESIDGFLEMLKNGGFHTIYASSDIEDRTETIMMGKVRKVFKSQVFSSLFRSEQNPNGERVMYRKIYPDATLKGSHLEVSYEKTKENQKRCLASARHLISGLMLARKLDDIDARFLSPGNKYLDMEEVSEELTGIQPF